MPDIIVCEETATSTTGPVSERGVVPIAIITPGWGSSGYYPSDVLEAAADAKVFAKGTHMYLDHPAESEKSDRPERSVRDLVAVLESDATWDGRVLAGDAKVFGPYRELFRDEDFVSAIGVSIRASAAYTVGEAEGRKGVIMTELGEAKSIDFVTRPGRGGAVLSVLESTRDAREAMSEDIRTLLDRAVEVATPNGRAWVRDFDPDQGEVVYTRVDKDDEDGFLTSMWRDTYTVAMDGLSATLGGAAVEVRQRTEYVPVPATDDSAVESSPETSPAPAAGQSTATESEETTMATTQIEEAELGRLRQDAERVPTLTSERDAAVQERDTLRDELHASEARRIIAESNTTFTTLERAGLMADLPTVEESGALDVDAFTTRVTEAAAERATINGEGTVRSLGNTEAPGEKTAEESADPVIASAFGRTVNAQEG
jgi:hypothetical protein